MPTRSGSQRHGLRPEIKSRDGLVSTDAVLASALILTAPTGASNGRPERNDPGTSAQPAGIRYRGHSRLSENRRENPNCHLSTVQHTGQTKEDGTAKTLPSGTTYKTGSAATLPACTREISAQSHGRTTTAQTRYNDSQTQKGHQASVPAQPVSKP